MTTTVATRPGFAGPTAATTSSRAAGSSGAEVPAAVTPVAGVEAALERIAEVNPVVNALCLVDAEAARGRARELEARLERGEDTGPLTGWTFTVKDAMQQEGYPC